jgi:hypothetical protein
MFLLFHRVAFFGISVFRSFGGPPIVFTGNHFLPLNCIVFDVTSKLFSNIINTPGVGVIIDLCDYWQAGFRLTTSPSLCTVFTDNYR